MTIVSDPSLCIVQEPGGLTLLRDVAYNDGVNGHPRIIVHGEK
jgi:hypothetical protein